MNQFQSTLKRNNTNTTVQLNQDFITSQLKLNKNIVNVSPKIIKTQPDYSTQSYKNGYCINHPEKKAKYILTDQKLGVCSKCAISLVEKGYKISEIEQQSGKRDSEIKQFLKNVDQKVPKLENMMSKLKVNKESFQNFFQKQNENLRAFFQQIDNLKQRIELQLKHQQMDIEEIFQKSINQMQRCIQESTSMKTDITMNLDRIINQIEENPFKEIMQSYESNLQSFDLQLDDLIKKTIDVTSLNINNTIDLNSLIKRSVNKIQISQFNMNNKDNEENNLYVSFENKDKFQNININNAKFQMDFTYSPNIEQQFNRINPQQQYQNKPFKQLFEDESEYEEAHSQMIEKEDIENTYNMMVCDNDSEQEEISLHLNEMEKSSNRQTNLFSSPQFKDQ